MKSPYASSKNIYLVIFRSRSFRSIFDLVRWQKPIFGVKCAISGNNHFFAFFISSLYVDEIWPGRELAIGLAFSESKNASILMSKSSTYVERNIVVVQNFARCTC